MEKLKPKVRSKGFKSENISIGNVSNDIDNEILSKIETIIEKKININLNSEDNSIINKIYQSYQNFLSNTDLESDEMILKGHELLESKNYEGKTFLRYLIYRYKYNIYPNLYKVSDYPPCVQIEPTSFCNFRCVMCYQADTTFSGKSNGYMGHMNIELFKKIIDELEGNVEAITFASRGEPTMNKAFIDMLDYCNGKFLGLKMNTNASLLNEKLIHKILSSDLQTIVFSIDSANKENYEKIRVNGNFERVMKNLELFNKIKKENYSDTKKIIRVSGVKINDDQNLDKMNDQWKKFADIIAFTNYIPWESSYENDINEISSPCKELWTRTFVWYDGKVNPCDFDYKSILSKWNIKFSSINEIWNSQEYNHLRQYHINSLRSQIEPCKRCINV